MKAQVKVGQNYMTGEGDTPLDVFREVALLTEMFGDINCGKCGSEGIKYVLRKASDAKKKKEYLYPEAHCTNRDCGAKLGYSQTDDGVIYPKRFEKDSDGEYVLEESGKRKIRGKWGWTIYNKDTGEEE